jgi:hypothetical protein
MRTSFAAALALGALLAAPASAGTPASKHAVAYGPPAVISEGEWQPILAQQIKTANDHGLAITVSLECGLYTNNVLKSKSLAKTDNKASVKVRVRVDGEIVAAPGEVTFCSRSTKTSATFAGIFTKPENQTCFVLEDVDTTVPPDGIFDDQIIKIEPDCLAPEESALLEDSMTASSYFFYVDGTTAGEHTVHVEAYIDEATGAEGDDQAAGDQGAKATLGYGSMLVEQIRVIRGSNGETLEF